MNRITVIACGRSGLRASDLSADMHLQLVPCTGRVSASLLLARMALGDDGVLVLGRHQQTCRLRGAEDWAAAAASVYHLLVDILRVIPDLHLYLVGSFRDDIEEGLFGDSELDRLTWVCLRHTRFVDHGVPGGYVGSCGAGVHFQDGRGKNVLPLDAVVGIVPWLTSLLSLQLSCAARVMPGISRWEDSWTSKGGGEIWSVFGSTDWFPQEMTAAATLGTHHVFLNAAQKKHIFRKVCQPVLSHDMLRRLEKRSSIRRNGFDLEYLKPFDSAGNRGRVVGSFYRPRSVKGVADVLAMYQTLAILGKVDGVQVTWGEDTPIEAMLPGYNQSLPAQFVFHSGCDRATYLKIAGTTAVAIWNSNEEASACAPIECAAIGCVPLFPDKEWVRAMPDWPLIYKNMDEARALVLDVLDNREKYAEMSRKWVREYFDVTVLGPEFLNDVRRFADQENLMLVKSDAEFEAFCKKSAYVQALDKFVEDKTEIRWADLRRAAVMPRTPTGVLFCITHHDLPALMFRRYGFVDDVTEMIPVFRRKL